ncbi:YicC/YloC family endoribonuclease [Clostridium uliginosum]|uniref:TIGR00255 family protein n=1 Tax=Clostridium uliginosum TaxID=119641 RepID=A0A1I1LGM8_9CLOT|nr:YicC/YloC family endoribonuclease [Clostridium uliginosum]SFC72254.1 TIGR00255 family protein [Clostridium uliginosum]
MIRSMTSFGRAQSQEGKEICFSIEMKSVNHRYLDVNIRMPKAMLSLEEKIRRVINNTLSRGKVDVFINYKSYSKGNAEPVLNSELAKQYYNCLKEIQEQLNLVDDITTTKISKLPEVITLVEKEENLDEILNEVLPLIQTSLNSMDDMRIKEGEKLKSDILIKLNGIETYVKQIEEIANDIPENYRQKLRERLKELLTGVELDETRIAQEVAILCDKAAVDEEVVRLRSHLSQVRHTLELEEPVGRKLDFIIQEMNREANTIGSKSTNIEMTNKVINIKDIIEKIREQVQNIE